MPPCPRRPLLCPRTSFTATVKKAAYLLAPRQPCREGITGDRAAVLRDRRAAALARPPRCTSVQLFSESRSSSTGSTGRCCARGDRAMSGARGVGLQRGPNHSLKLCRFLSDGVCDRMQSRAVQPWPPGPRRLDRARRALSNHLSATFWLEDVRICIRSQGADLAQRRRPSPSISQSSHRARDLRTSMEPFVSPAFEAT